MAQTQLPAAQFVVGGQTALTGLQVPSETTGFEEDAEDKQTQAGQFKANITYSRRATKSLTLECESSFDTSIYTDGGGLDATLLATGTVWEIRSATVTNTRGPVQVALELVSLTDTITA
jgi:hypothetical protein